MTPLELGRGLKRSDWYNLWRVWRKHHTTSQGCSYTEKLCVIEQIRKYEVDGKVRLCDRFMDCDHAVSTGSRLIPANYYAFTRVVNDIYDWAEGPGGCWLDYPEKVPERDGRDLLLEAYEDGHPHSVSEARYESH